MEPFPARAPQAEPIRPILDQFDQRTGQSVSVAGRLGVVRDFGKLRFAHVADRTGSIQVAFKADRLPLFWPRTGSPSCKPDRRRHPGSANPAIARGAGGGLRGSWWGGRVVARWSLQGRAPP
jgi:hypothetical protein